jgi:hypothetical protein
MAFDCADRHVQNLRDFRRIEILLIAQQHDGARAGLQRFHQLTEAIAEKGIPTGSFDARFRDCFEADARPQFTLAGFIDAAVTDGAAEPPRRMRGRFDLTQIPVELQKDILSQFFGASAVTEKTQREAEYERLVFGDNPAEIDCHTGYYVSAAGEIASGA